MLLPPEALIFFTTYSHWLWMSISLAVIDAFNLDFSGSMGENAVSKFLFFKKMEKRPCPNGMWEAYWRYRENTGTPVPFTQGSSWEIFSQIDEDPVSAGELAEQIRCR